MREVGGRGGVKKGMEGKGDGRGEGRKEEYEQGCGWFAQGRAIVTK